MTALGEKEKSCLKISSKKKDEQITISSVSLAMHISYLESIVGYKQGIQLPKEAREYS